MFYYKFYRNENNKKEFEMNIQLGVFIIMWQIAGMVIVYYYFPLAFKPILMWWGLFLLAKYILETIIAFVMKGVSHE